MKIEAISLPTKLELLIALQNLSFLLARWQTFAGPLPTAPETTIVACEQILIALPPAQA